MTPHPESGRTHALDALRGSMMLLGLVIHSAISYVSRPVPVWPVSDPAAHAGFDFLVVGIHVFRMPVFFVMAGFFSGLLAHRSLRALIRNRLERVALPFVLAWLVLSPVVLGGTALALTWQDSGGRARPAAAEAWPAWLSLWQDNTFHLWFLLTLLELTAVGLLVAAACRRLGKARRASLLDAFEVLVRSPWRLPLLAGASVLTTLSMPGGAIETPVGFRPDLAVLLAYAPFFAFGWLLHSRRAVLPSLERWAGSQVALGLLLVPVHGVAVGLASGALPERLLAAQLTALVSLALSSWLLTFGSIGLCLRFLGRGRPLVRYLSDASYWLYLVHLPFTLILPAVFASAAWPAEVKFGLVLTITAATGLISYHYLVRATWIGRLLNGRRYARAWPSLRGS